MSKKTKLKHESDPECDIDPQPITPEEVQEFLRKWRCITECPEGESFTKHLTALMRKVNCPNDNTTRSSK